jgi:hypothetical protein
MVFPLIVNLDSGAAKLGYTECAAKPTLSEKLFMIAGANNITTIPIIAINATIDNTIIFLESLKTTHQR